MRRRSNSRASAMWPTSAEPTTAASATRAMAAACAGVRMPKPTATGSALCRRRRADRGADLIGQRRLGTGDAGDRHVVEKAAGVAEHLGQAAIVGGRGHETDEMQAVAARRQAQLVVFLGRQVDHDQPVDPRRARVVEEALRAVAPDRVVVAHQHDRRRVVAAAHVAHQIERPRERHAGLAARAGCPPGSSGHPPSGRRTASRSRSRPRPRPAGRPGSRPTFPGRDRLRTER